ncbi:MAG: VCBS repeat-containing protein [Phycisphaerales bacterium]|nr:MAG: VCBS repeat-containing protein [Phycisphaerales bacterium]
MSGSACSCCAAVIVLAIAAFAVPAGSLLASDLDAQTAAELDAHRLIGKAHYENAETPPQFEPAIQEFRRCIELAPDSAVDHFNLGLTLMRGEKYDDSLKAFEKALQLDPELLAATYVSGIIHKRLGRARQAIECLQQVTRRDLQCAGAFYNLGICYKQLKRNDQAVQAFLRAVELRPTNPSYHYQLMILYRNMGLPEDVKRHREIFDRVKDTIDDSEKTTEALERSRYSYILDASKLTPGLEPNVAAKVRFADVTERAGIAPTPNIQPDVPHSFSRQGYSEERAAGLYVPSVGGAVTLADFDSDGDYDVYVVCCATDAETSANRLYRNEGAWRFTDVTDDFDVGDTGMGLSAVFGDFDHDDAGSVEYADTNLDLYVVNYGPNVLYRKLGHGAYEVDGAAGNTGQGVAVLDLPGALPDPVEIAAHASSPRRTDLQSNAYIVFDYRGPADYKVAGADMSAGKWIIGHYDGAWTVDAFTEEGMVPGRKYSLLLRCAGSKATLFQLEAGEQKQKVTHEFDRPLAGGAIGLAACQAVARFDDIDIRAAAGADSAVKSLYVEDFKDGRADRFQPVSGDWRVVDWKYENVSARARVAEPQFGRKAAFLDYDHDYDLDIFVANDADLFNPPDRDEFFIPRDLDGLFNTLMRNNGNGTFTIQTDEAGLLVDFSQTRDVLYADFDGDDDTDLFVVNANAPSLLFANARMGRFDVGGAFSPPLPQGGLAAAQRDLNRDGSPDLLFATADGLTIYTNDGAAHFTGTRLELPTALTGRGVGLIGDLDHNNDGWADVLLVSADGSRLGLLAGAGPGRFQDVSSSVGLDTDFGRIADLAMADLDSDGDDDLALFTHDHGLRLLRNDGGERANWINVRLIGRKVNRNGYGARVEIARGGHYDCQTATDGWIHFGLGDLDEIDVVRVVWDNGQAQNVVRPSVNANLDFVQYVKVSASCGFLYAFDGRRFELVNEILGIGPLGVPMAPGIYHQPDCTELTLIEGDRLRPRDGYYDLRLTEELREITYADQITLRVIDHPAELEIIPNEYFTAPPFPEDRFYAVADAQALRAAVDDRGNDVLELLRQHDGRCPTFPMTGYDGLAEPHSLVLDLGDLAPAERILLFLDSWIYWAESSVIMALAQDPRYELTPLRLEVRDAQGRWVTAVESVGLPTSKGLVVPIDLTGRFPAEDYQVRLSTNMCVYFDRIFVGTADQAGRCRQTELPVSEADLHYRGFSEMTRDEMGYERFDYHQVSPTGSWSQPQGLLTRYGDVTPLLQRPDDMYVIFGPGDELTMRFDAGGLPDVPDGWVRDFVFYANGWVKDGDLNTKYSQNVTPLPFHGMSRYPYPPNECYPDTPVLRRYLSTYNTRPGIPTAGPLR